jgi:hypothetical protein
MKLNQKQDDRTLHVTHHDDEKDGPYIVLIERERQKWMGKNRWIESRVLLTADEAQKLASHLNDIRTMQWEQMSAIVLAIHAEMKRRNPIWISAYAPHVEHAAKLLAEIAAGESANPTSDCGPTKGE